MTDQPRAPFSTFSQRGGSHDTGVGSGATTEIGAPAGDGATGGVRGTVRIAPAVLIELIELTVRDIPGVAGFQPRRRVERILPRGMHAPSSERRSDATAGSYEDGGVRVRVTGDQIEAEVSIVVRRGVNILELSRAIQRGVGVTAGRMLGMTVAEVNVYVAGIEGEADEED